MGEIATGGFESKYQPADKSNNGSSEEVQEGNERESAVAKYLTPELL